MKFQDRVYARPRGPAIIFNCTNCSHMMRHCKVTLHKICALMMSFSNHEMVYCVETSFLRTLYTLEKSLPYEVRHPNSRPRWKYGCQGGCSKQQPRKIKWKLPWIENVRPSVHVFPCSPNQEDRNFLLITTFPNEMRCIEYQVTLRSKKKTLQHVHGNDNFACHSFSS